MIKENAVQEMDLKKKEKVWRKARYPFITISLAEIPKSKTVSCKNTLSWNIRGLNEMYCQIFCSIARTKSGRYAVSLCNM